MTKRSGLPAWQLHADGEGCVLPVGESCVHMARVQCLYGVAEVAARVVQTPRLVERMCGQMHVHVGHEVANARLTLLVPRKTEAQ